MIKKILTKQRISTVVGTHDGGVRALADMGLELAHRSDFCAAILTIGTVDQKLIDLTLQWKVTDMGKFLTSAMRANHLS